MPQLVKGGKYIFGWTKVRSNGEIRIPDEAFLEYRFNKDKIGILMSGSKRSGGFGLTSRRLLSETPIGKMLESLPELFRFELREAETITIKKRKFCWININKDRFVNIPKSTLKEYDVLKNKKLLF